MNDEELIKETMMLDYSQLVMNNVYLHKENKELKQKIEYYENFEINKTIDKIRVENNKRFKEHQEQKDKVVNDLLKRISNLEFDVEDKQREIERLNNIINELEKYINETKLEEFEKVYGRRYGKTFTQAEVIICNMILNKLDELKGVDK